MHPTSLSRFSNVFQPLSCQRKKCSTLSLVTSSYSVPGKVQRQHLCWTALQLPILPLILKEVAKLGRAAAAASSFSNNFF